MARVIFLLVCLLFAAPVSGSKKGDSKKKGADRLGRQLKKLTASFDEMEKRYKKDLQELRAAISSGQNTNKGGGSTFIRWGSLQCPADTTTVYKGVVGGRFYSTSGGGSNLLCLTTSARYDSTPLPTYYSSLFGAEYRMTVSTMHQDVPCTVCRARQSSTIMVPATNVCPSTWTAQYSGQLAAANKGHLSSEYVCLDRAMDREPQGEANSNGVLFYPVATVCGSLHCPPFQDRAAVLCVVCAK